VCIELCAAGEEEVVEHISRLKQIEIYLCDETSSLLKFSLIPASELVTLFPKEEQGRNPC
jgi:hypothetical protein